MLQYAWLCKDLPAEIRAYNHLAIVYFNSADLKNSKYYHERGLNMIAEPEDSRTRIIACQEILRARQLREESRMIGMYTTPAVDYKGKPTKRLHRTN